jgi:hypothetical protein
MKMTMMKTRMTVAIVALLAAGEAMAQSHQPYSGLQSRSIKALSPEQIADLRAGRGMGLALAAELNGYPGPLHVIELADQLALSAAQRARMQQLFDEMKQETIGIGNRLIEQEDNLNRQFAERRITEASLAAATATIGQTQAALRAAHLRYHLLAAEAMTPAQMQRYAELRGYTGDAGPVPHRSRHHK